MYDAKAYKDGYPVEKESIRQFSDYIERFPSPVPKVCGSRSHVSSNLWKICRNRALALESIKRNVWLMWRKTRVSHGARSG